MGESVPNRFNPMGFDIVNGGTQVEPTEGVVIYVSNTCTGAIVSSAISLGGSIGNGQVGSGMVVYNGGYADNPYVDSGGVLIVSSGGFANGPTINGGTLIVKSGGEAVEVIERNGATCIEEPGGSISYE